MHFVFDGGTLPEDVPIELQEDELDEFRFVEPTALDDYLPADHQHPGGRRDCAPGTTRRPPTCRGSRAP